MIRYGCFWGAADCLEKILLPYSRCIPGCRFIINGECKYNEMHVPTVAVDFDRVIFTHKFWQGHDDVGEPLFGVQETLSELRRMGFKIMIWTTRNQKDIIENACRRNGIPFDYINENPNQAPEISPFKPAADYYIDDRAVRFISWRDVLQEIIHREITDPYYREPGS